MICVEHDRQPSGIEELARGSLMPALRLVSRCPPQCFVDHSARFGLKYQSQDSLAQYANDDHDRWSMS